VRPGRERRTAETDGRTEGRAFGGVGARAEAARGLRRSAAAEDDARVVVGAALGRDDWFEFHNRFAEQR